MSRPTPCEFRQTVELNAPIEAVFDFHGDPHNVTKISPGWQSVRLLEGKDFPQVGEGFQIEVRLFGFLPLRWHGVWRQVDAPDCLIDEALKSPFAYWRHRHLFESLPSGRTRMIDHVSYQFPGGWLGKWFGETLGRVQFWLMFTDRHKRTARWFREHSTG